MSGPVNDDELRRALSGVELRDKPTTDDAIRCPQCRSAQVHAEKRGWNFLSGLIGSGQILLTCLKCGHQFKPGEV
jgi:hypothetical protein